MDKVIKKEKLVVQTVIVAFLILSFSSISAFNEDTNAVDKNSSIYKYSAIENTTSYFELIKNNENLNQKKFAEEEPEIDDFTKKLEDITERHKFSTKRIDDSINSINTKSKLGTFITGNNLGILKFQMVQIIDKINLLNDLSLETEDSENKIKIEKQLKLLEEEKLKVENFILDQDNKFSLFGWFVVML